MIALHSLPSRLSRFAFAVVACHLCSCSERVPEAADHEAARPERPDRAVFVDPADAPATDGEAEAVASGRAEIFVVERHLLRRGRDGIERVQVGVTLPQLIGDEGGIARINGILRHLALDWPTLPRTGHLSPEEADRLMRSLAATVSSLRPEDWPARIRLESLEGHIPPGFFGGEAAFQHQEESSFAIRIIRLDAEAVVLGLEMHAVAATSHYYEGQITLDLHNGELVGFAAVPAPEE
jgi:hypothetical protein